MDTNAYSSSSQFFTTMKNINTYLQDTGKQILESTYEAGQYVYETTKPYIDDAVACVSTTFDSLKNTNAVKTSTDVVIAGATATATAAAVGTTGAIGCAAGCTSVGITSGSTLALAMSTAATTGIGMPLVSVFQSAGTLFAAATGGGVIATSVALVAPAVAGVAVYKYIHTSPNESSPTYPDVSNSDDKRYKDIAE